jgi:hypothetical protein
MSTGHGAAFRSRARVQTSDFKWIQGEDLVTFYESSPDSYRGFCRRFAALRSSTNLTERALAAKIDPEVPSRYGIGLATLDDDPGVRPACHSYVASKAPWFTITDDLLQFPEARGQAYV